jgi:putative peptide zinc metalloprotease protein
MSPDRVTLVLAPEGRWLALVDVAVRQYAATMDFSEPLQDMIVCSLLEACEELIRVCGEKGVEENYEVSLDCRGEAVISQITYSGRIALNPQEVGNYDKPSAEQSLDAVELDAFWLYLIKKRMDRVFFRVDGARRVLEMVKYHREAGKARQFWVMGLAPRLREDLHLHLQTAEPDEELPRGSLLQDPQTGAVLQLDAGGTFVAQRLDGKRTFHEIYLEYIDRFGMISPQRLAQIFEALEEAGMVEGPGRRPPPSRARRVFRRLLNPSFSIPHADAVVSAVHRNVSFLLSPLGLALLLVIGLSGISPLVRHGNRFWEVLTHFQEFYARGPWLVAPLYLLALASIALHELGHGVVCKHFGGQVHRLGVMWYLAMFIFFCDTSSAWNFPKRSHRILVSLGGPMVSWALLGGALWAFGGVAGSGSPWEAFWVLFSVGSMYGLIMNFNPFIKMDAYYLLMDWTNIPNLRSRSFAWLQGQLFGWIRRGSRPPADGRLTRREKIIFGLYGLGGSVVTAVFVIRPLVHYSRMLVEARGSLGYLIFGTVIVVLVLGRLASQGLQKLYSLSHREYKLV